MKTVYQIVGMADVPSSNLLSRDELAARFDLSEVEAGKHLRVELQGQPRIKNLCGPMWGGFFDEDGEHVFPTDRYDATSPPERHGSQKPIVAICVRYETWAAYEQLSR